MVQFKLQSSVGPIYLVASETGLHGIYWKKQPIAMTTDLNGKEPAKKYLRTTILQLDEYFIGKRRQFKIPMQPHGTDFQKVVWKALTKIPYGKTCSYREIAKKIKRSKAVRAVGTANGKNPFSILVPCHRVIAADGTLGGYAGGLTVKRKLLALETRTLASQHTRFGKTKGTK